MILYCARHSRELFIFILTIRDHRVKSLNKSLYSRLDVKLMHRHKVHFYLTFLFLFFPFSASLPAVTNFYYSTISLTTPALIVLPPSRIAKRRPFSMAIGVINSPPMVILSPGITISTPSGSSTVPVTSVVLK